MTSIIRLAMLITITLFAFNTNAEARQPAVEKNEIHNVIEFDDEFNEDSITVLLSEIEDSVDLDEKVIRVKFNSHGGSILAGFRLINEITRLQTRGFKFVGIVDRVCMSMCFMTLQHMDERLIYKYGLLLDHPASGGNNKAHLDEISELVSQKVIARLKAKGLSDIAIRQYKILVKTEFLMNSKTALALGLVDKVINPGEENVSKNKVSK